MAWAILETQSASSSFTDLSGVVILSQEAEGLDRRGAILAREIPPEFLSRKHRI